jgi:hypothetical protein
MLISCYISQADAIRAGSEDFGSFELDVELSELSDQQREKLALITEGRGPDEVSRRGALRVKVPHISGLLEALEKVPLPIEYTREMKLRKLSPLPASAPDIERIRAARDVLFKPLEPFPRYVPATDVPHTPTCSSSRASFRVEKHCPSREQRLEIERILEAARSIEGLVAVTAKLHRGLCPECGGCVELYGALVEVDLPEGLYFSRELALKAPH